MIERAASVAISIIIPTFNEAHSISQTLDVVDKLRGNIEVILVDGGSTDDTIEIASRHREVKIVEGERGRGIQMHAGACVARGGVLWFLHADTHPAPDSIERITEALSDAETIGGNFSVHFDGDRRAAAFLTWLYPQLRKLGLLYGDSGIFVRREVYNEIGGFQSFPIFEDLDLVRRLRRRGRIVHLPSTIVTSSRRFENRSFAWTFTRWASLQTLYWFGVHPRRLNRLYAPIRRRPDKETRAQS
jgi:rSAM/selenodomain-associated transferase 2